MKLSFAAALTFSFTSFIAMADMPPAPLELQLKQPDGFRFIATVKGSRQHNWLETEQGLRIRKKGDTWYFAQPSAKGLTVAGTIPVGPLTETQAAKLSSYHFNSVTPAIQKPANIGVPFIAAASEQQGINRFKHAAVSSNGNIANLLIRVSFSDIDIQSNLSYVQQLYFGSSGSVKDYYEENSYGTVNIIPASEQQGTVNDGIIDISLDYAHPNIGDGDEGLDTLVSDVWQAADEYVDFATFDSDGDGAIQTQELSITVLLAGYENSYGGEDALEPNIWAHAFAIEDVTLDQVQLSRYLIVGEQNATSFSTPFFATLGVFAHELGHLTFNLPDLYDTDDSSNGIGQWGLMGGGAWNFLAGQESGETPAHMLPWSKLKSGFITPLDIEADGNISVNAHSQLSDSYRIWLDKYRLREYFLLSNRQLSGYDAGLPGHGLLISHVDERISGNADEARKQVDIEAADGLTDMDMQINSGDEGDPFPGATGATVFDGSSTPSTATNDGAASGVSISQIVESNGTINASIELTANKGGHVRYDEQGASGYAYGYGEPQAWTALNALNSHSDLDQLDGFEVYLPDDSTLEAYLYENFDGSAPDTLLYTQKDISAAAGWNQVLFSEPQAFSPGSEITLVLNIVGTTTSYPAAVDHLGANSERSFLSSSGEVFSMLPADLNQILLLSSGNSTATDSDNDGVPDDQDAFPNDPNEWLDTDGDGTGNNADTDDDNDGMPDSYEMENGLDPLNAADAARDNDNDGFSNLQEYLAGTDPNDSSSAPIGSATAMDYDGDGKADIAVRNASSFIQYIRNSSDAAVQRVTFGKHENDIPVSGDFDGDGIADVAVRRPGNQMWYILNSSDGAIQRVHFGKQAEDIPVPADYDGDGITDIAVRRPSNQMWYILNSSDGAIQRINFGKQAEDIPVPADYDGDGKADVAVRRASTQMWYILNSSDGQVQRISFGSQSGDIPIPADYDGDGKADVAVRRPGTYYQYILNSSDGQIQRIVFGKSSSDIPIPADYDGDGKADIAVRRPGTYYQYILNSSDGQIQRVVFGKNANYIPVAAPVLTRMSMAAAQ